MADTPIPGEWQFINTLTAPPASGQARLDNIAQTAATKLWISKTPATGGDVSAQLAQIKPGQEVSITNKADASKWQVYALSGSSIDNAGYTEFPVVWRRGGGTVPEQRLYLAVVSTSVAVNIGGQQMQTAVGQTTSRLGQTLHVTGNEMEALASHVEVTGQLMTREFAYPFQGKYYSSPGMTLRQYYAGQALTGFIANSIAANLIGNISAYCFKVADSMIAYEALMTGPPPITLRPVPVPPTGVAAPPGQANITLPEEEALAMQARDAAA